jgi:hypothetical protein
MTKKQANTILEFCEFFESLPTKTQARALSVLFCNINDSAIINACNEIELLNQCELKLVNPFKRYSKNARRAK